MLAAGWRTRGDLMRRREFIALLSGAAAAWPLAARAQPDKVHRIGVLMNAAATNTTFQSYLAAFVQALRQFGWNEGQNARVDVRWNAGDAQLARTYAAQLIGLKPDVILSASTKNLTILRQATNTVPIVFVQVSDPVAQGFMSNLARPGGNITGFSNLEFSVGGKCVELIKQLVPDLARVAVMFNPDTSPQSKYFLRTIEAAAQSFALQMTTMPIRATADIEAAVESISRQPNSALILPPDSFTALHHKLIVELTVRHRLPVISMLGLYFARAGGLMSYAQGAGLIDQYRQAAAYVDRILNGAKPGDLPVQLAADYRLSINRKTATILGLEIPPKLLFTADEVIE
jgi:putative ABC transport system substrate-binding protein